MYTDNNLLTYILTMAKLDATGQRWVVKLANYNFSLYYRLGKSNVDADALSRIPWASRHEVFDRTIDESVVKAIICTSNIKNHSNTAVEFSPTLFQDLDEKDCGIPVICKAGQVTPAKMTNQDWVKEQMEYPVIGEIHKHLLAKTLHKRKGKRGDPDYLKNLLKYRWQLVLRNDLVYRKVKTTKEENPTMQFLLPLKFRERALEACHDEIGHLGTRGVWTF